jgi:hypothetical protein
MKLTAMSGASSIFYMAWLPFPSAAINPRLIRHEEVTAEQFNDFLAKHYRNDRHRFNALFLFAQVVKKFQFCVRNDGLILLCIEPEDKVGADKIFMAACGFVTAIKRSQGHRDMFHGEASRFSHPKFEPVEVAIDPATSAEGWGSIASKFASNEFVKKLLASNAHQKSEPLKAQPQQLALLAIRERFGLALSQLMKRREEVRSNLWWSNMLAYFVLVLMMAVLSPPSIDLYQNPNASLFEKLSIVFCPVLTAAVLIAVFKKTCINNALKRLNRRALSGKHAIGWQSSWDTLSLDIVDDESRFRKWVLRPLLVMLALTSFYLPFVVPKFGGLVNFPSPSFKFPTVGSFLETSSFTTSCVVMAIGLFVVGWIEIFKKRSFILKLIDYM